MKKSRFPEEQIAGILKEVDAGMKVSDVCRKHGNRSHFGNGPFDCGCILKVLALDHSECQMQSQGNSAQCDA